MSDAADNRLAYLLGGLATVLGWQVTKFAEDIRATRSVAYWVEPRQSSTEADQNPAYTLVVENVSREKSLAGVTFVLMCDPADPGCIKRGSTAFVAVAPTLANDVDKMEMPSNEDVANQAEALREEGRQFEPIEINQVELTLTMAAGGRIEFDFERVKGKPDPIFYFKPTTQDPSKPTTKDPLDIYVFDGKTIRGWAVRHYIELLLGSLAAVALTLLTVVLVTFFRKRVEKAPLVEAKARRTRKG
jgi:hypothetical protein